MKKLPAVCMLLGKVIVIAIVCFNFLSPSCSHATRPIGFFAGAPFPDGFPQIRSWDGTTLTVDIDGLRYQATCKSSIAWNPADPTTVDTSPPWPRVTYPACELPSWGFMGVWWGLDDHTLDGHTQDAHTLSMRRGVKGAGRKWMTRQEGFVITSVKAIGSGLIPAPPPQASAGPLN
jgi:hypothetical protein